MIGNGTPSIAVGLYAVNVDTGNVTIHSSASQFNANDSDNRAFGMEIVNSSMETLTLNAVNSSFNTNTGDALASGLYAANLNSASPTVKPTRAPTRGPTLFYPPLLGNNGTHNATTARPQDNDKTAVVASPLGISAVALEGLAFAYVS